MGGSLHMAGAYRGAGRGAPVQLGETMERVVCQ